MMSSLLSLGLKAVQWNFLTKPDDFVAAAANATERTLTLAPETTRRQFRTARVILKRLNGSDGQPLKGVLLADDVGLGKTSIAALVAWIVASAGEGRGVRILAPNDAVTRCWKKALLNQVEPLRECAPHLGVQEKRVKGDGVQRLAPRSIQVVNHSYVMSNDPLNCDLLIVDEAHRAKSDTSLFSQKLKRKIKHANRVLILTATPFSIDPSELNRMLALIGGHEACGAVLKYKKIRDQLYSSHSGDVKAFAKRLIASAEAAIAAISKFVIRHGVDDLTDERKRFGDVIPNWTIPVPPADEKELEIMLRMDRALRLEKRKSSESTSKITNDPRFHVGWRHFDKETSRLSTAYSGDASAVAKVISHHAKQIKAARDKDQPHSKMKSIDSSVKETVENGEKVVLFCHHHATAQELTVHLSRVIPEAVVRQSPNRATWKSSWNAVLTKKSSWNAALMNGDTESFKKRHNETLLATFIDWLCSDLVRSQVARWLIDVALSDTDLAKQLESRTACRHPKNRVTMANAAWELYRAIVKNDSSFSLLRQASKQPRPRLLQGVKDTSRVLAVCDSDSIVKESEKGLFMHSGQPDLVLEIFNSPFGPDVLVATDKLSEGIDLHRYCRHLIHYELDPSPIRTVQRNGRIRRVNSWAAVTGQKIQYAYPAFKGTRDQRLVSIMRDRIANFSLLLGGVKGIDLDEDTESHEIWRNEVIKQATKRLKDVSQMLVAKETQ